MTVNPFAFGRFPDVDERARVVYALGHLAVPAAGTFYLGGVSPYGGTGFLFRRRAYPGVVAAQLIAVGLGVYGYGRTFAGSSVGVGPGIGVAIKTLLGMAGATPEEFEHLLVTSTDDLVVRDGATPVAVGAAPTNKHEFHHGVLPATWQAVNNGAAPATVAAVLTRRAEAARFDIGMRVVKRVIDADGSTVLSTRKFEDHVVAHHFPQPLEDGADPQLFPAYAPPGSLVLDEDEAFGVECAADAWLEGARAVALLAIAITPAG